MIKKLFVAVFVLLLVWVVWPSPIDSVSYMPPENAGFTGVYAPNDKLHASEVIKLTSGFGPEDVAIDAEGHIYGGLQDGRIVRLKADGSGQETFATIEGGRPLGLHFDAAGNLIVADAYKGLLLIAPDGAITVLATEHGGRPFVFADDLDIASDGKIYFSDASDTFNQAAYRLDLLEGKPHGRFLVYDPVTGETEMLLDELYFANGIALSQQEDFVLINETTRYRVLRYWLKGERAGTSDIFIDALPGFPDGISANRKGVFWLAIPSPRNPLLDFAHPKPWLKNLLSKLPKAMQPSALKHGMVVALDEKGNVIDVLQDSDGDPVHMITSVQQEGDTLYLGSLDADQIVRLKTTW